MILAAMNRTREQRERLIALKINARTFEISCEVKSVTSSPALFYLLITIFIIQLLVRAIAVFSH